jgi:dTDP-4-dehydrorhamnose 3,5-epimerase-like enzyme
MEIIKGVALLNHEVFRSRGGELMAFEEFSGVPFPLKRVFFLTVSSSDVVRGGHANSCHELLIAVSGSVIVEVDNGSECAEICLGSSGEALWVRPGVLVRLRNFASQTIVLAIASACYAKTRHFERPQPHLIATDGTA